MAGDGVFFPLSSIVFTDIKQKSQVLYHKLGQFFREGETLDISLLLLGKGKGRKPQLRILYDYVQNRNTRV